MVPGVAETIVLTGHCSRGGGRGVPHAGRVTWTSTWTSNVRILCGRGVCRGRHAKRAKRPGLGTRFYRVGGWGAGGREGRGHPAPTVLTPQWQLRHVCVRRRFSFTPLPSGAGQACTGKRGGTPLSTVTVSCAPTVSNCGRNEPWFQKGLGSKKVLKPRPFFFITAASCCPTASPTVAHRLSKRWPHSRSPSYPVAKPAPAPGSPTFNCRGGGGGSIDVLMLLTGGGGLRVVFALSVIPGSAVGALFRGGGREGPLIPRNSRRDRTPREAPLPSRRASGSARARRGPEQRCAVCPHALGQGCPQSEKKKEREAAGLWRRLTINCRRISTNRRFNDLLPPDLRPPFLRKQNISFPKTQSFAFGVCRRSAPEHNRPPGVCVCAGGCPYSPTRQARDLRVAAVGAQVAPRARGQQRQDVLRPQYHGMARRHRAHDSPRAFARRQAVGAAEQRDQRRELLRWTRVQRRSVNPPNPPCARTARAPGTDRAVHPHHWARKYANG